MPESKRPLKVFLCHAHADRDSVRGLYARLTKDGVDAWLDKERLLGGADWEYEIRKAVRESDVVVVCHSKQFNQKGFRQKEVKIALEEAELLPKGEIFIIPARLEECDVLDDLKRWHWVDLFEADGYERLLRALRVRADKIGATLQVKRSWLPRITTPRTKNQKLAEIKKVDEIPESKLSPKDDVPLPQGNFPDGWDTEWMPSSDSEKAKIEGDEKAEREETAKQLKTQNSSKRSFNTTSFISVMAIVFCVASVTLIPILGSLSKKSEPTPTPQIKLTNTVEVISSPSPYLFTINTSVPLIAETHTPKSTPTKIINSAPALDIGSSMISEKDGMTLLYVPEGKFLMGTPERFIGQENEMPQSSVFLKGFWIDKTEITNSMYALCVEAQVCQLPYSFSSYDALGYYLFSNGYYDNPEFAQYPVTYVTWDDARAYCAWSGRRLPTEAEWEKSARGTDGRIYPWGNKLSCSFANYYPCVGRTTRVGSYESGKSVYGIYDMAGNVWEWTSSIYMPYPYDALDGREDLGASKQRVSRGGTYRVTGGMVRVTSRNTDSGSYDIGFRCAKDATP